MYNFWNPIATKPLTSRSHSVATHFLPHGKILSLTKTFVASLTWVYSLPALWLVSPALVFCLFVCLYTPAQATVFELQTWNFKPRPYSRKLENGFLDFLKKSFFESLKIFLSKNGGFSTGKGPWGHTFLSKILKFGINITLTKT